MSLRQRPNDAALLDGIARMLATNPVASVRDGAKAVAVALRAERVSGGNNPAVLDTLAAAYAESGRFPAATQTARRAIDLAEKQNKWRLSESIRAKMRLYEKGIPFHQVPHVPRQAN